MSLQEFIEEVTKGIEKRLGDGYRAKAKDILKNNGVVCHAVTISSPGCSISPCIYMDSSYGRYREGQLNMEEIVGEAICIYKENTSKAPFNREMFSNYGNVRPKLRGRLVNTGKNQKFLEDVPHREFLDLSLVYTVETCGFGPDMGSISVANSYLSLWGVSEEDLYEAICRKMEEPGSAILQAMPEVLKQMGGIDMDTNIARCPIYILSNKNYRDGAVQMLNKRILKSAAGTLGDFAILPSSVHELILVPAVDARGHGHIQQLAQMVQQVNDTQVEEQEILSYHVYRYFRETGEIAVAA